MCNFSTCVIFRCWGYNNPNLSISGKWTLNYNSNGFCIVVSNTKKKFRIIDYLEKGRWNAKTKDWGEISEMGHSVLIKSLRPLHTDFTVLWKTLVTNKRNCG